MMPDYVGRHFDLDVIAGHITTETISGIPGYRGIWHDGASHYYVDGNVVENGHVLVLRYDEATGRYSGEGISPFAADHLPDSLSFASKMRQRHGT